MSEKKNLRFETRQIHGGYSVDSTGSRGIAIYPTAAYHFKSCDYAASLFELSEPGNIYTRLHNPTTASYEQRIASLYNAVGALAVSSGMAAIFITVTSLAQAGDNIVAAPFLYGGTYNQFRVSLRKLGIEDSDAPQLEAWKQFVEMVKNPEHKVQIALVGKYTELPDAYKSISESFVHAGAVNGVKVKLHFVA